MTTSATGSPGSLLESPLAAAHERLGATMTSFAGWRMPLRYGSETAEHLAVRSAAGLFDLSHMGEIAVNGSAAGLFLDYALVGELSAVAPGRARYTMLCAPDGGVLDDLVVYRLSPESFLVIANAANTGVVYRELVARSPGFSCSVADRTLDYALIAIQGPAAAGILGGLCSFDLGPLKYYAGAPGSVAGVSSFVARTGYTGEDGFEIYCPVSDAVRVWDALLAGGGPAPAGLAPAGAAPAGLVPAGLAARDTLRLEAGMPLYGNELGPDMTPFEANLGRVVKFGKPGDFVGRAALADRAAAGPRRVLTGLTVPGRRVPRHGYPVLCSGAAGTVGSGAAGAVAGDVSCGVVTSGAPSPTLGVPIAMAYLEPGVLPGSGAVAGNIPVDISVDIRGTAVPAVVTDLPFYRRSN